MRTIVVQGNVGAGKTHFIDMFSSYIKTVNKNAITINVREPTNLILELFAAIRASDDYDFELTVMSYQFQIIRYYDNEIRRLEKLYRDDDNVYVIMERCHVDGIDIFTKLYNVNGLLRDNIYNIFSGVKNLKLTMKKLTQLSVVYLNVNIETSVDRVKLRSVNATDNIDDGIDRPHLTKVYNLYNDYVNNLKKGNNDYFNDDYKFITLENDTCLTTLYNKLPALFDVINSTQNTNFLSL